MMGDTLFTGVRLLDPSSGLDQHGDLLVRDGRIADFGPGLGRPDGAAMVIEDGAILCPGLVDMRAALGEPGYEYRETIASAAEAAAAGGITTLARLARHAARDRRSRPGAPAARARRGDRQPHHPALRRRHQRLPRRGPGRARPAARGRRHRFHRRQPRHRPGAADALCTVLCARLRARIVQHPEEPSLAAGGAATEGELATRLGLPGIPAAAEAILVARDIRLAALTGGAVHFAHVSTAEAVALIRRAKCDGVDVTCDTAPPYFDLNETAIGDFRTYAKLSPPLRKEADRLAIVAALADGTIDAIASDHQPRDADDKRQPFAQATPGERGSPPCSA